MSHRWTIFAVFGRGGSGRRVPDQRVVGGVMSNNAESPELLFGDRYPIKTYSTDENRSRRVEER